MVLNRSVTVCTAAAAGALIQAGQQWRGLPTPVSVGGRAVCGTVVVVVVVLLLRLLYRAIIYLDDDKCTPLPPLESTQQDKAMTRQWLSG